MARIRVDSDDLGKLARTFEAAAAEASAIQREWSATASELSGAAGDGRVRMACDDLVRQARSAQEKLAASLTSFAASLDVAATNHAAADQASTIPNGER